MKFVFFALILVPFTGHAISKALVSLKPAKDFQLPEVKHDPDRKAGSNFYYKVYLNPLDETQKCELSVLGHGNHYIYSTEPLKFGMPIYNAQTKKTVMMGDTSGYPDLRIECNFNANLGQILNIFKVDFGSFESDEKQTPQSAMNTSEVIQKSSPIQSAGKTALGTKVNGE